MGQKVNPVGNRLGITRTWDSIWYVDQKNYVSSLHEDLKIRKYIDNYNFGSDRRNANRRASAEIAKVEIFRKPDRVTVVVHTSRPGVVIGSDGKVIQDITKNISKISSAKVEVKIKEIKKAESNAQLIASNIARQLTGRVSFRRAMKKAIGEARKLGVGGIRIQCSGRLNGADMARREWYKEGRIPLHTFRADIDYGVATANTTYGATGVKVWVFHKEVLKKDMKEDAGQLIKRPRKQKED
jgi:small subunit ribosomal protein S3